jgi:hypothetical protein
VSPVHEKDEQGAEADGKSRPKKAIYFRPAAAARESGGRAETGVGVSNIHVSQISHKKALVSRADWLKTMKREETELNRESPNSSFFFGVNAKLGELFRRAKKGDVDAARMLLGCLTYNVGEFEKFCSSKTRIAKHIVVVGESWPLLHTGLKANKDGALTIPPQHVLRKLGVVRGKRRYATTSPGTAVAATLYKQMEFYRHTQRQQLWDKLSENVKTGAATVSGMSEKHLAKVIDCIRHLELLSPSNYSAWWTAAEPLFIWQWGKEFQDDPWFENCNVTAYRNVEPHVARSAKRRDIKKAIKQGFESLANSLRDRVLD